MFVAKKFDIRYSSWKLMACLKLISGHHIYDALHNLAIADKKGALIVKSVLEAARVNANAKGGSEDRYFVKIAMVGKGRSHKKIDIRARGKQGVIKVPKSSITIWLEERSQLDFYKMVIKGEAPPAVGRVIRRMLYQNKADFGRVSALSHITTSEGRKYRRTQFRRYVQMVRKDYQKRGINMRESKIERNLLEKVARDFVDMKDNLKKTSMLTSRVTR